MMRTETVLGTGIGAQLFLMQTKYLNHKATELDSHLCFLHQWFVGSLLYGGLVSTGIVAQGVPH